MRLLGWISALGALTEVTMWTLAMVLWRGSWRYDISALNATAAPRPWLVMMGETALAVAIAALAIGLHHWLPRSDHRLAGCALLALASAGTAVGGVLGRSSCEESIPSCDGHTFTTVGDWADALGAIATLLGVTGAALILATVLPQPWARYSRATAAGIGAAFLLWTITPYPWVGTTERLLDVLLVTWVGVIGARIASQEPLQRSHDRQTFETSLPPPPGAQAHTSIS